MITAVRSSVSALKAASISLSARADNIANVRTNARVDEVSIDRSSRREPAEEIFRPTRSTFVAREHGGVDVEVEPVDPSHRVVFIRGMRRQTKTGWLPRPMSIWKKIWWARGRTGPCIWPMLRSYGPKMK